MLEGEQRPVRVLLANDRPFLLWAGIGLDARIMGHMSTFLKRWLGRTGIFFTVAPEFFRYEFPKLQVDGRRRDARGDLRRRLPRAPLRGRMGHRTVRLARLGGDGRPALLRPQPVEVPVALPPAPARQVGHISNAASHAPCARGRSRCGRWRATLSRSRWTETASWRRRSPAGRRTRRSASWCRAGRSARTDTGTVRQPAAYAYPCAKTGFHSPSCLWPPFRQPPRLLERVAYTPPPYEKVQRAELYSSRDEFRKAAEDKRFRLEKAAYKSGDLRVFAYVYAPVKPAGRMPAVIFNRGSFVLGRLRRASSDGVPPLRSGGFRRHRPDVSRKRRGRGHRRDGRRRPRTT